LLSYINARNKKNEIIAQIELIRLDTKQQRYDKNTNFFMFLHNSYEVKVCDKIY